MELEFEAGLEKLDSVASDIVKQLSTSEPFCLWLKAPLGGGKTTLTAYILKALGLDERIPVTSPTYTYMNEYEAGKKWYAHLDLYRTGEEFSIEDMGLLDTKDFAGYFIEWPENAASNPFLKATHTLEIFFCDSKDLRKYCLKS